MIVGFDQGVIGMGSGETREIRIAAKDAYGEKPIEEAVPKVQVQDLAIDQVKTSFFLDTMKQPVPLEDFTREFGEKKVGDEIPLGTQTGKVVSIASGSVLVEFENLQNPFYKKQLAVGLEGTLSDGAKLKILTLSGEDMTIERQNTASPFYGKGLAVGTKVELQDKTTVEILREEGDNLIMGLYRPLTGKDLVFTVTIRSVEKSTVVTPTDTNIEEVLPARSESGDVSSSGANNQ